MAANRESFTPQPAFSGANRREWLWGFYEFALWGLWHAVVGPGVLLGSKTEAQNSTIRSCGTHNQKTGLGHAVGTGGSTVASHSSKPDVHVGFWGQP